MVEKPGPLSTCTRPPSWSVETSIPTRRPATWSAWLRMASTTFLVATTPAVLRPVSMMEPTWYARRVRSCAWSGRAAETPPMKSCPTRWAVVMPLK